MTLIFIDERLPNEIEAGAKAKPRYSTDIIPTDGGWEVRNSRWSYPLMSFEFNIEPGTRDENEHDVLDQFLEMFHACGGSAGAFRFNYWRDKPAVDQLLGVGDGSTKTFQLMRTYTRGAVTRYRKITRPITGTVTAKVAGVVTVAAIDYSTGLLTFSVAPVLGAHVTASFENDVPVRFADDELEIVGLTDALDQPVNIILQEIRE
jgi:uncharacterized protein (TIGR02217 family)